MSRSTTTSLLIVVCALLGCSDVGDSTPTPQAVTSLSRPALAVEPVAELPDDVLNLFGNSSEPLEKKCDKTTQQCICDGAADCVAMALDCCTGKVVCTAKACTCTDAGTCDEQGNKKD